MDLSKQERRTYFGINWYNVIFHIGRGLLIVMVAAIIAVVTNLRHRIIEGELKVGAGILLLLLGTTVLNIIYAVWVSAVYRWVFGRLADQSRILKNTIYMVGAMLPVVGLNMILLQILVFSHLGMIFKSAYWLTDFPFFFVPLLLYVLAVLYWAPARLLGQVGVEDRKKRAANYLDSWLKSRKMLFLMSYLDLVYGSAVIYVDNKVRIKDILMISLEDGVYFFILRDGTKIATSLNSVDIEKWLLANWFLTTKRGTYVNMLYVEQPKVGDKVLKLTHSVNESIRDNSSYAKINSGLNVNRRQQPKLDAFLLDRESLSHEGWDEMIAL
ncbi:hypothetical protein SAMN05660841_03974 [Sphingobacterium nematocida]|uniref:LytTr DNA-binding domain-containing protein n=1 Tax=Sphingobacterium nematocida TaxID=1513896 RepID=A0A1T5GDU6_9SPHI|nr:hypothetical protein [Sphingobacterium nematocida]SKC06579.1 hypothetical protein SAMN05660841_03974 [Sphingobacterium nematocida]